MKRCPYCAEEIQDEAIVCRYCGSKLEGYPEINKSERKTNTFLQKRANVWSALAISLAITVLSIFLPERSYSEALAVALNIDIVFLSTFLGTSAILIILVLIWPNYFFRIVGYGYLILFLISMLVNSNYIQFDLNEVSNLIKVTQRPTATISPTEKPIPTPTPTPIPELFLEEGYFQYGREKCYPYTQINEIEFTLGRSACFFGELQEVVNEPGDKFHVFIFPSETLLNVSGVVYNYGFYFNRATIDSYVGECVIFIGYYTQSSSIGQYPLEIKFRDTSKCPEEVIAFSEMISSISLP